MAAGCRETRLPRCLASPAGTGNAAHSAVRCPPSLGSLGSGRLAVPDAATMPIADAIIASGRNSPTTTVPPTSGRRTRCCQSRHRSASRRLSGACTMRAHRLALTATWQAFMPRPAAVPSSGPAGAATTSHAAAIRLPSTRWWTAGTGSVSGLSPGPACSAMATTRPRRGTDQADLLTVPLALPAPGPNPGPFLCDRI